MPARICAVIVAIFFLTFGICGLLPACTGLAPFVDRFIDAEQHAGGMRLLWHWMPVNPVHNGLYIALGVGGILCSPARATAILYCRGVFAIAALFACAGFLPWGLDNLWGLLPLFGWNIAIHTVLAFTTFYYGCIYPIDWGGKEPKHEMRATMVG